MFTSCVSGGQFSRKKDYDLNAMLWDFLLIKTINFNVNKKKFKSKPN